MLIFLSVLMAIQKESEQTDIAGYRIEDEFFFGILREKTNIKEPINFPEYLTPQLASIAAQLARLKRGEIVGKNGATRTKKDERDMKLRVRKKIKFFK